MTTDTILCAGYGSLVYENWARASVPGLSGFGLYRLKGYRRVFGKVHPFCIYRGEADWQSMEAAACFIEPDGQSELIVSGFYVPAKEYPKLRERECDYREADVALQDMQGLNPSRVFGKVFEGYGKDKNFPAPLTDIYKHWPWMLEKYTGAIYRNDILPSRAYLWRCLAAHALAGDAVYQNFLETTYLADRKTTLKQYIPKNLNWKKEDLKNFDVPPMP